MTSTLPAFRTTKKEAICIIKATCRRLISSHIKDCYRRLNYSNDKLLLCLSKLKELIPTPLQDTLTAIADKQANKTTEQHTFVNRRGPPNVMYFRRHQPQN